MKRIEERPFFGWYVVTAAAVITLLSAGTRFAVGPFFKPIMEDLNVSRTALSVVVAVSLLIYGIGMPIAGRLVERFDTRSVLIIGTVILSGSMIWTAFARGIIDFFIAFAILLSLGLSFTSNVTMTPIVSRWFPYKNRGLALTLLTTGAMGGIAIMTPVATVLVRYMGWQGSYLFLAVVFFLLIIPTALFIMRERPQGTADVQTTTDVLQADKGKEIRQQEGLESEERSDLSGDASFMPGLHNWKDALKTRSFWQLSVGLFVCGFSMNLLGSHGVPMLTDHGFSAMEASYGIGLIGLVAIASTVVIGLASERFPRKDILALIYLVRGLGFVMLMLVTSAAGLYIVSALGGLVWAGSNAMTSALIGDYYGLKWVGVLYGWTYFGHQVGAAVGSFLGGWGYETFGTHWVAFGTSAILLFIASSLSFRLPLFQMKVAAIRAEASSTN